MQQSRGDLNGEAVGRTDYASRDRLYESVPNRLLGRLEVLRRVTNGTGCFWCVRAVCKSRFVDSNGPF